MAQNVQKIIDKLEKFAPLDLQEDWDNSGWQINLGNDITKKILLTTSVTNNIINFAVKENFDLIISHHPMIFSPIKKIADEKIVMAIQNNIQIYSMHTNFDKTQNGTSELIAAEYKVGGFHKINDFVVVSSFEKSIPISEILEKTKKIFNIKNVKTINYNEKRKVQSIAFCAGSGGEFINEIIKNEIDLYITSDLKYHQIQDLPENVCIFDVGHLESEKICLKQIKKVLEKEKAEIIIADEKSNVEIL